MSSNIISQHIPAVCKVDRKEEYLAKIITSFLLRKVHLLESPWSKWIILAALDILYDQQAPLLTSDALKSLQGFQHDDSEPQNILSKSPEKVVCRNSSVKTVNQGIQTDLTEKNSINDSDKDDADKKYQFGTDQNNCNCGEFSVIKKEIKTIFLSKKNVSTQTEIRWKLTKISSSSVSPLYRNRIKILLDRAKKSSSSNKDRTQPNFHGRLLIDINSKDRPVLIPWLTSKNNKLDDPRLNSDFNRPVNNCVQKVLPENSLAEIFSEVD